MIGESRTMQGLKAQLARIARFDSNVLITGETGTGKELVAGEIHRLSPRCRNAFICINCAAIPESLFEGEIFGYERGAYTGAVDSYTGKLKLGDGGSVFLDEIGEMTRFAQSKLLRVIECKEFYRVGSKKSTKIDTRFLAATNKNVEQSVEEQEFRKDLFYRLNVVRVHVPPLREHPEDIPLLIAKFIADLNRLHGRQVEGMHAAVMKGLLAYSWPGNVRELRNLVEASFITSSVRLFGFADLPEPYRLHLEKINAEALSERTRLLAALVAANWNKARAARRLHWSRMTLYRKLAKYQIDRKPMTDHHELPAPDNSPATTGRSDKSA